MYFTLKTKSARVDWDPWSKTLALRVQLLPGTVVHVVVPEVCRGKGGDRAGGGGGGAAGTAALKRSVPLAGSCTLLSGPFETPTLVPPTPVEVEDGCFNVP
jgi:hypothetical protein